MPETSPIQVITAGGAAAAAVKNKTCNHTRSPKQPVTAANDDAKNGSSSSSSSSSGSSSNSSSSSSKKSGQSPHVKKHEIAPLESVPLSDDDDSNDDNSSGASSDSSTPKPPSPYLPTPPVSHTSETEDLLNQSLSTASHVPSQKSQQVQDYLWLFACFMGIMVSFVLYGLLLEYTTSGGRKLHELSFVFVTSALYTATAAAGRYVRDEVPTTMPPGRFAILGCMSMGSTFCSVRSLRYVIFPIQVLAKSCKPVPVMIIGALLGKRYPLKKYVNVLAIVIGVGLFMGGGDPTSNKKVSPDGSPASQLTGIVLLFISLCFDGGTGAYEDKLMAVHSVGPFDLMYNIQMAKMIIAGVGLLILNQVHVFLSMVNEMGFMLIALGLSGAMGQVFIFVTISKFGALTCSIIGLARKVTTLVASIYFYGHSLNGTQGFGLTLAVASMIYNFMGKKGLKDSHGYKDNKEVMDEKRPILAVEDDDDGDVELQEVNKQPVLV